MSSAILAGAVAWLTLGQAGQPDLIKILREFQAKLVQEKPRADEAALVPQVAEDYRLETGDVLELRVPGEHELEITGDLGRIGEDGSIRNQWLGSIYVRGRTLDQAREGVHALLERDFLVNPRFNLELVRFARQYYVVGLVRRPGIYPLDAEKRLTLPSALETAGGNLGLSADKILVERQVEGTIEQTKMDLDERKARLFEIKPGDRIRVMDRWK